MFQFLLKKFGTTLYIQIWKNRLKVTNIKTLNVFDEKPLVQIEVNKKGKKSVFEVGNKAAFKQHSDNEVLNPFEHPRTLIADFFIAQKLIQGVLKRLGKIRFIAPLIIIHPMEEVEGGLTKIEVRAFRELGLSVGARTVVFYQGDELSPNTIKSESIISQDSYDEW